MATIGVLSVALVANNSKFNRGMDDASRRTRRFGGQMDTLKARVAGATASLRTMGTVAAGFAVVKLAKGVENFNRKMLNSQAIMGDLTDGQMRRMQKVAIDTAKVTSASSGDVADSFFFLASAGLDAEQSMASVGQVALFAQAGMFDMARATDLATDAQSALGMTVPDAQRNLENLTRVTDVLVKANTLANGSVEQFSEALTNKFGASLRVAGKSIEEGVALLAAFADQGIKGAEAGTAASIVMRDLQTKAINNAAAFREAKVAVFDASGEMRNLADIVGDLENKLAGMSDEQKKATLLALGFSDKSVAYTQAVIGMSDKIRDYEKGLKSAGGTTKDVADKQLTPFQKAMNALSATLIEVGLKLTPVIEGMAKLMQFVSDNIVGVLKFAAAFLSFAIIAPKIYNFLVLIEKGIKSVTTATTILKALGGPKAWAAIAVGIGVAAGAVALIDGMYEDLTETTEDTAATTAKVTKQIEGLSVAVNSAAAPVENLTEKTEELADAQKAWQERLDEGRRVWENTRTPAENLAMELTRLSGLLGDGAIDMDTYTRAVDAAKKKLDDATESSERFGAASASGPKAIQAGTQEASRFIAEARFNSNKVAGGQLVDVNRQQLDVLRKIEQKVAAPGGNDEVVAF